MEAERSGTGQCTESGMAIVTGGSKEALVNYGNFIYNKEHHLTQIHTRG